MTVSAPVPALNVAVDPLFDAITPPSQFAGSFQLPPAELVHVPLSARSEPPAKTASKTITIRFGVIIFLLLFSPASPGLTA